MFDTHDIIGNHICIMHLRYVAHCCDYHVVLFVHAISGFILCVYIYI